MIARLSAIATAAALFVMATVATRADDYKSALVKAGTLTVGTTGASPPATMYDENAKLTGYDIDLTARIAADLGLKVEYVVLDWAGMLAGVQAGRFDVVASSVARSADRIASADFIISDAYVPNGVAGAKRAGDDTIKGWKDICGKRVGIVKGAAQVKIAQKYLPENCLSDLREYPGWTELLLDLQNRRINALIGNHTTPAYLIKSGNRPIEMLGETLEVTTLGLVVRKSEPALAAAINGKIAAYRADGTLAAITGKYLGTQIDWSAVKE